MKLKLATLCVLTACSAAAHAQTNVTLFGLIDNTLRYSTNTNAAGDSKTEMADGLVTGSRWGVHGTEDLGGGLKALVWLESGFLPDTGVSNQGGRLFGRQLYVGLDGGFGKVLFGRQYTVAHSAIASWEVYGLTATPVGYQSGNYTGLRYDNTVKYTKALGPVTLDLGYTFGEVAGSTSDRAAVGIAANYAAGPLRFGATYQQTDGISSIHGRTITASKQKVWGVGGSYKFGSGTVYAGYTNNDLDAADTENDVLHASFKYSLTPTLELLGAVHHDKLDAGATDGKRTSAELTLDYWLSKRSDVYVSVGHTKLKDAWIAADGAAFGHDSRSHIMFGLRHRF